jgi:hypothetical protein
MRRIIAGIAGLGLIGGVATVVHNNHGATVRIRGRNGQMQSVHIPFGKKQYQCPPDENKKLNPILIRQARIQLTVKEVMADIRRLKAKYPYPGAHGSRQAVARYNAGVKPINAAARRGQRLLAAGNATVNEYNSILHRDCTAAPGG